VVDASVLLEHRIEFWTWALLHTKQSIGHAVTADLGFAALMSMKRAIARLRIADAGLATLIDTELVRGQDANNKRNEFHSLHLTGKVAGPGSRGGR